MMNGGYGNGEINNLIEENKLLKKRIGELDSAVKEMYTMLTSLTGMVKANMDMANACGEGINSLQSYVMKESVTLNNMKYEICDLLGNDVFFKPKLRSNDETLRLILEEGKSLARFGDGEFSIAGNILRHKFQRLDEKLAERIRQVLISDNDKLLVAVADNYGSLEKYNEEGAYGIRFYMTDDIRKLHASLLNKDKVYSDAYITRPYVLYKDNLTDAPKKRFEKLKEIWHDKNIVIVEGAQTRLGVRNDLFGGAKSIRRILAPATSSFDRYDDILQASLEVADNADIFILAIGPSSGVLAYDLTLQGIQAVDVGHIDIEYEWFLAGKGTRVSVPGKYNNEVEGGDEVEEIYDEEYIAQIITDLS